jgi:hypothetical protein
VQRFCLLLLVLSAPAHAATLAASSATATGPAPVTLNIELRSAPGEAVAGVQFELAFAPHALSLQGMEAGPSATAAGKLLSTNPVAAGRHRVIIAGLNQTAIADGPVVLLSITVTSAAPGTFPVAIENVVLSDPAGKRVPAQATPGAVVTDDAAPPPPVPAAPQRGCGCTPALAVPSWGGYMLTGALLFFIAARTLSLGRANTRRH